MTITAEDIHDARNPEQALVQWNAELASKGLPTIDQIVLDERKPEAFVSRDWWVIDCPECGSGAAVWEATSEALCLGCGHRYKVALPSRKLMEQMEDLLKIRPQMNRNWDPRRRTKEGEMIETPEFLERENLLMIGKAR